MIPNASEKSQLFIGAERLPIFTGIFDRNMTLNMKNPPALGTVACL
jgi:hypothetical protein